MSEWYCVVAGNRYGPASKDELLAWINEGRLGASDRVWRQGMAEWQPVSSVEELSQAAGEVVSPPAGAADRGQLQPHRGGAVLALGILGLVFMCLLVFGIIAWVMGKNDLKEMDARRMDPAGRGLTQAGKICGMVGVFVGMGIALLWVVQMVFMISMMSMIPMK